MDDLKNYLSISIKTKAVEVLQKELIKEGDEYQLYFVRNTFNKMQEMTNELLSLKEYYSFFLIVGRDHVCEKILNNVKLSKNVKSLTLNVAKTYFKKMSNRSEVDRMNREWQYMKERFRANAKK